MKNGIRMISLNDRSQREKWDEIVTSFKNYDVYYLADYVRAFQLHGDGEPTLIYYQNDYMKAMNVVMKRDLSECKFFKNKIQHKCYYDFTTPYGYGGFLLEGEYSDSDIKDLFIEYRKICKRNGIISEFNRYHPILDNSSALKDCYEVTFLGETVAIDLTAEDEIWSSFSSSCRNRIRKSVKSGCKVYWGRSEDLYEKFHAMYNKTMDKDHATDYYYFDSDFFKSILTDLKYNSLIFYVELQGEIIAMSIILFCNGNIHYHLGASELEYLTYAPVNLMFYEISKWGVRNGYKRFHLGGGVGSKSDSLLRFKKNFNKNSNYAFSIGKLIFDEDIYQNMIDLRGGNFVDDLSFFPSYRKE